VVLQAVSAEERTKTVKNAAIVFFTIMSSLVSVLFSCPISIDKPSTDEGIFAFFKRKGVFVEEAGAPEGDRGRRNGRKSAYSARDGVTQALNIFTETAGGIAARQQCAAQKQ